MVKSWGVLEGEMLTFIKNIFESLTWPPEQCSGSVGIERLMMASRQRHWVHHHFFGVEKRLFVLVTIS